MKKQKNLSCLLTGLMLIFSVQFMLAQTDANKKVKGICIYIDYPDAPANVTRERLNNVINNMDYQEEDINRSLRKYWYQNTRRNFDLQHDIFFYRAPKPATYYAGLKWDQGIELWKEALESVVTNNPNYNWGSLSKWSLEDPKEPEFPNLKVNTLKSVVILSSTNGPAGLGAAHSPIGWILSNGIRIGSINGSTIDRGNNKLNIFIPTHEVAHSLFTIPDTYDGDMRPEVISGGTAKYSIMSAQGPDLEPIGAPFLYLRNWGTVIEPKVGTQTITMRADGDSVVVLKNRRDPNEFFSFEIRKKSTPGNSLFPVPIGLLIWHSDLKVPTFNRKEQATPEEHYEHSIVQKDGLMELEKSGSNPPINAGDIYVDGDVFNDTSSPNTKWWSGESSGIEVKDIQLIDGDYVRFTVVVSDDTFGDIDFIPKDNWKLVSQTPFYEDYDGTKAFDNDLKTYYHVPLNKEKPHGLAIDLGDEYEISEFYYTANDNFSPPWEGRIKDYELYFSMDGENWGQPVVAKQFLQSRYRQYIKFPKTMAKFVKFSAVTSHYDNSTSIVEIDFVGKGRKQDSTELIEAENHAISNDVRNQPCSEGGQNVGYINIDSWMDYENINFPTSGIYLIEYRVSSKDGGGKFYTDLNNGDNKFAEMNVASTGDWQKWTTVSQSVDVKAGIYKMRINSLSSEWNINWIKITRKTDKSMKTNEIETSVSDKVYIFPNPVTEKLYFSKLIPWKLFNISGKEIATGKSTELNMNKIDIGFYILKTLGQSFKILKE